MQGTKLGNKLVILVKKHLLLLVCSKSKDYWLAKLPVQWTCV